ncbi:hypothetical protein [Paenibacillus eucommiae]|uniref:Uncharacterized protein (DUF983 family) n=1 Tax=Paenibacillus eucommiae TaxID=1355755 RepID=A0ABS4JDU1_9BACL|nr:hypothetical protein [Paenibacillus eucommiae]MBP1996884.1 uncharacterized protein (DUF983 family) [Paenibacillus eucommiae]
MLAGLFTDFLIVSMTTSLVIIGLMMLSPMLSKQYAAKWKYWIWLILTVRLNVIGTIYLTSKDKGLTSVYDESYDKWDHDK